MTRRTRSQFGNDVEQEKENTGSLLSLHKFIIKLNYNQHWSRLPFSCDFSHHRYFIDVNCSWSNAFKDLEHNLQLHNLMSFAITIIITLNWLVLLIVVILVDYRTKRASNRCTISYFLPYPPFSFYLQSFI